MTFRFEDMPLDLPSTMSGRVTAFDPPRRFSFTWGPPAREDHLDFELYEEYQRRGVPAGAEIPAR